MERLAQSVPDSVRAICERLQSDGYQAYTVGGAVRDAMLGREPGDWDVTTSALPSEVTALFRKTIPTGIEHGTVTVMHGSRLPVEVTTFRGEGTYSDARRPDSVTFGVSLEEDLARRDFVINAMAYDPIREQLEDPFGGAKDIASRVIRAVGEPVLRFTEDGLRVMRAVRFVSVLDFEIESATESALSLALPSLSKVARERVRVELVKLLGGKAAGRALEIAYRNQVLTTAVPILAELPNFDGAVERALKTGEDAVLRLAAMLLEEPGKRVEKSLRDLTMSNHEQARIVQICRHASVDGKPNDAALRALLGKATRERAVDLVAVWRASGRDALANRAAEILEANDALVTKELAIGGGDVMEILGLSPGREVGILMRKLLDAVHVDPSLNTREGLSTVLKSLHP